MESAAGPAALARVWEGPDRLPTMEEIRRPADWLARTDPASLIAG